MSRIMHFPEWDDFGPKMRALKERERKFVWAYFISLLQPEPKKGARPGEPSATQAAKDAGYNWVNGERVAAHRLMHREEIIEAIQEVAARELRGLALPAVVGLSRLLKQPDHPEHRKAIEMVLNRSGFGEKSTIDVQHSGEVMLNHTDRALEDLRRLLDLGASREKLEEIFGYSGLARYEKMLASQGAREALPPKVIEHKEEDHG